jgi:hypothetical protein
VIPRPVASAIIVLVTIVWAANFVAQFLVEGYEPDVAINGIVGAALAFSRKGNQPQPPAAESPVTEEIPAVPAPPAPPPPPEISGRHARKDDPG